MKRNYARRPRTGIMLAHPFEEKRLAKWRLPFFVQPKYDGERCLVVRGSYVELVSSTGLPITNLPHIKEAALRLPIGIYDGETYIHSGRQLLGSIMRSGQPVKESIQAKLMIFDMKCCGPQHERLRLSELAVNAANTPHIQIAPVWGATDIETVQDILAEQMALGYEGVVLRDAYAEYQEKRVGTMLKIKPRSLDTYTIIGYQEAVSIHNEPKGCLGALLLRDADSRDFKVGTGFTSAQRAELWAVRDALPGHSAIIKYQYLTERGVPYAPVVVEVR